jgi:hypothetical protein
MSEKLSFLFYYNWEEQFLELDNDSERWNLLHNIIKFETQRELDFESKGVKHAFLGMKHGLVSNQRKYFERAERSRINGKKHTGKNKVINEITQQVILEPREPDNSEKEKVNTKEIDEKRKEEIENKEVINDNNESASDNIEMDSRTELEVLIDKLNSIENWEDKLVNNGTGWVIDELIKSFQLSMDDRYAIIRFYDEMNSQRNSE